MATYKFNLQLKQISKKPYLHQDSNINLKYKKMTRSTNQTNNPTKEFRDSISSTASSYSSILGNDPFEKKREAIRKMNLIPLNCTFGIVTEHRQNDIRIPKLVRSQCKFENTKVLIAVALRRPGCLSCRVTASLLRDYHKDDNCVSLIAIVKESGAVAVDKDIQELYHKYFPFPIYKDEDWSIYKHVLGNRKDSYFNLVPKMFQMKKRLKENGITSIKGTFTGGDSLTAGGILIFDKEGHLRSILYEDFGSPLQRDHIQQAINDAMVPLQSFSL